MTIKVIVRVDPVAIEFEVGSIAEAHTILTDEKGALAAIFSEFNAETLTGAPAAATETAPGAPAPDKAPGKPRGRPPKNAAAPPPLPVPGAAPPTPPAPPAPPAPPVFQPPVAADAPPVPEFLKRETPPAPALAAPPAPPAPPAPTPGLTLAPKVAADLKRRATGSADNGASLVAWLATAGIVIAGASFDEALAVVQFQKDDALAPVAAALGVQ